MREAKATEYLLPTIEAIQQQVGEPLERVGVVKGPGSFTGIRVGLATAQGLKAALGIPVHGFSKIDLISRDLEAGVHHVLLPLGRTQAVWVDYSDRLPLGEPRVVSLDAIKGAGPFTSTGPIEGLESQLIDVCFPSLVLDSLAAGTGLEAQDLAPLYLRPADAIKGTPLVEQLLKQRAENPDS